MLTLIDTYWKVDWHAEEWERIVGRLKTTKGKDHMKVFVWKALMGALPTREKVECREIGSEICKGCKANIEPLIHLFHDCPCISFVGTTICKWIFGIWGVKVSKMQLITAS